MYDSKLRAYREYLDTAVVVCIAFFIIGIMSMAISKNKGLSHFLIDLISRESIARYVHTEKVTQYLTVKIYEYSVNGETHKHEERLLTRDEYHKERLLDNTDKNILYSVLFPYISSQEYQLEETKVDSKIFIFGLIVSIFSLLLFVYLQIKIFREI